MAEKIGGGGGGRADLAEAGGKNPDGLAEAYEVGRTEIASAPLREGPRSRLRLGAHRRGGLRPHRNGRPATGSRRARRSEDGLARLDELVREHGAERVVVGKPLTMRGEAGEQAAETEVFVTRLRETLAVPVESFDERFTTDLAEQSGGVTPRTPARLRIFCPAT